ncbi:hypothetical protein WT81_25750 [Burkholderia stagnalis]|nr:hypothetical protein WT81_25750 [Burkholderia stagnalis]KWN66796.1 hypothetical protein WT90_30770 [Burkholderia stagnalis]
MGARMPRRDRDARRAARPWYRRLGPSLLAGASDDDPSGIAVYAQAGSWFGFHLLWLPVVVLPMMVEVQLAAASVGCGRYREGVVAANRRHGTAREDADRAGRGRQRDPRAVLERGAQRRGGGSCWTYALAAAALPRNESASAITR